jgi:hypothetical protein
MRCLLAAVFLMLSVLIPGSAVADPEIPIPLPYTGFRIEPEEITTTIFCLHRRTIQSYIDLYEEGIDRDRINGYLKKDFAKGECVTSKTPLTFKIDEYTTLGTVVIGDSPSQGNLLEAVRVKRYWTILNVPVHQT